ncbi:MAG: DUF2089 domain-containing protein [Spirochaetales bacterium]|nr:DUF2089 domain-containing protein [Spirochaetales bacterium]
MKKNQLHDCPVCGSELRVKVLACPSCRTKIEGDFSPPESRLFSLSREDLEFVEVFVQVRGSIKEMEKALGVSYPTVRGMLDSVIGKLGYAVNRGIAPEKRKKILDRLDQGEINAVEAAKLLKGDREEE